MNWGDFRIARRAIAGLAAAAALAVPAQASATTVGSANGALGIGSGAESATLTVTTTGSSIAVADSALTISAGSGCSQSSPKRVVCPAVGVKSIYAVLGSGNDKLTATNAPRPIHVWAGEGNDTLLMRDGLPEWISCGAGSDRGEADADDNLAGDCESEVARPAGTSPTLVSPTIAAPVVQPPVAGTDDAPVADTAGDDATEGESDQDEGIDESDEAEGEGAGGEFPAAPVVIDTPATIAMSPRGDIAVGVTCTAAEGACAGSIELVEEGGALKARAQVQSARRRKAVKTKKAVVLGRAKFSVGAGAAKQVRVRLSRRGRQRIIKKKKRKTRAKIVITVKAPDGTIGVSEHEVSITAPKARRTSARRSSGKKSSSRKGRGR